MVTPSRIRALTEILRAGGIEDAELEAKWIAEDVPDDGKAREIAGKRAEHFPLQYLLGTWEFYGMQFAVGEGVLIPRADTETLVDAVLERYREYPGGRIADLCAGSGCIALALASRLPRTKIFGVELSAKAREYAVRNAKTNGLSVPFYGADVLDSATAKQFRNLDVIVSNPPYLTAKDMAALQTEVTYEPEMALDGGEDGLRFYREMTARWKSSLRSGGMLAYEVGIHQAEPVAGILSAHGFTKIEQIPDLSGIARVVLGYLDADARKDYGTWQKQNSRKNPV